MAVAQLEEPNSYWLPRGSTASLREVLQRVMLRLERGTPRQGWLIEEEVAGEGEAFACSSGGTLKLAYEVQVLGWALGTQWQGVWLAWRGSHE